MELRGFDSYEISLGDEMRGERASLGKSLEDAERDMRIKAKIITAIEDCDLDGFPNQSVIAGYVRSYARYLGMDAEECFQRFCVESGYRSPAAMMRLSGKAPEPGKENVLALPHVGDQIARSRFSMSPSAGVMRFKVSFGALTSSVALLGLICGLTYGGYALLQDIQRVGFAPLPEAPTVVADAPEIEMPQVDTASIARPDASAYEGGGALAATPAPVALPPVAALRRDGPISAIDPRAAGMFVPDQDPAPVYELVGPEPELVGAGDGPELAALTEGELAPETGLPGEGAVVLIASEDAWIRVREGDETILFEGILGAGETFEMPARSAAPSLRSGNAGGILIYVDGVAYGPLGKRGALVKNVSLLADDVRSSMPQVEPEQVRPAEAEGDEQRAEVRQTQ